MNRIETLLSRIPDGLDALLITSQVSRHYLTGLHASAGLLLLMRDGKAYFIIDFRYIERAQELVQVCEVVLQERLYEQLNVLLQRHAVRTIGIESEYMTVADFKRWQEKLPGAELHADARTSEILRSMRARKSPKELDCIRQAQKITDNAFAHICGYIQAGRTEREIACELLDYTYRNGSERPAFDFIVVSGKHSSMPHGTPGDKPVQTGDFITMDFGCVVDGYCSDMTRTVALGQVSDEQRRVYDTVLRAQQAAIEKVRAGVLCASVDAAARSVIESAGYAGCFGHGTGHAVGLEIHERPAFSPGEQAVCEEGMVITVEPGVYLQGKFGVRIEDMIMVTASGCENLTVSTKELLLL